jgi:predicted permease
MTAARVFLSRLRAFFSRGPADELLAEEFENHIDLLASDYIRRGMTPAAARAEARRQMGGVTQIAEAARAQRGLPFLETLLHDLRYAVRQLLAHPGFTAVALLTLTLGIGANTAIFRVLDAVLLRSLPVRDPERLVLVQGYHNGHTLGFSNPVFQSMVQRQPAVEGLLAARDLQVKEVSAPGFPSMDGLSARLVSGGYFPTLGVQPRLGRLLMPEDDRPDAPAAVVISHGFWQRAFGTNPAALGQTLRINGTPATLVGVAAPGFFGERVGSAPDFWLPLALTARFSPNYSNPAAHFDLAVMARLRPGVSFLQAQAALEVLYIQLKDLNLQTPGRNEFHLQLFPGAQGLRTLQSQFATPLRVLMGIAALVLLIACSNLGNLLLARAAARTHEIGVRIALGAPRSRLIRQLITESLLLAAIGAAAGFAFAIWGARELVTLAAPSAGMRILLDSGWRILLFTASVAVLATALFGLVPALAATRLQVNAALQSTSRNLSRHLASRIFVIAQVALSFLLVVAASLLCRTLWNIQHQDFGYRPGGVLMAQIPFEPSTRRLLPQAQAILDRLHAIPEVRSAAMCASGPLAGVRMVGPVGLPGQPASQAEDAIVASVTPDYFETMGIPLAAGRSIAALDSSSAPRVAVIGETAARHFFGGAPAVGRTLQMGPGVNGGYPVEVAGVAHDVRFADPRDPFGVVIYLPLAQSPGPLSSFVVRTAGDPALAAAALRQALREAAPTLTSVEIRPLTGILESGMRQERLMAALSAAFGILALVLASVGLYGVIAYGARRRTREIGIRLALGASRRQVTGLLLLEMSLLLTAGIAIGAAGALGLGRWVRSMLFGMTPHDPASLGVTTALLTAVAFAAAYLPARRAARLDPVSALRQE